MSRAVLFWVAVLFLFAGSVALWAGYSYLNSEKPSPPAPFPDQPLTDFKLYERSDREFDSKELKGKIWITSFFFASCPGFCPKQNQQVSLLAQKWGPRGVRFVSITVDPEQDTPSVLRDYARRFQADQDNWLFLTGPLPLIRRVGSDIFQVNIEKETHSGHLIVVDRAGKKRGVFDSMSKSDVQRLEDFLEALLAEEVPAKPAEKANAAEKEVPKDEKKDEPAK